MSLTDAELKALPAKPANMTLGDRHGFDGGLSLFHKPSGAKLWQYVKHVNGKQGRFSLGAFPDVSLRAAKDARDIIAAKIKLGQDPRPRLGALQPAAATAEPATVAAPVETITGDAPTFGRAVELYIAVRKSKDRPRTLKKLNQHVSKHLSDWTARPVASITKRETGELLQALSDRGIGDSVAYLRRIMTRIFRTAKARDWIAEIPVMSDDDAKDVFPKHKAGKHQGLIKPAEVGELLRALDDYAAKQLKRDGSILISAAVRLLPHFAVRPSELRGMRWSEVDFDNALWTIPPERVKTNKTVYVPLSRQTLHMLKVTRAAIIGDLAFPCAFTPREQKQMSGDAPGFRTSPNWVTSDRTISDSSINKVLQKALGYDGVRKPKHTGHGWRTTFSTLARSELKCNADHIELQLDHAVGSALSRRYNDADFLPERRDMMQRWSDYLDKLKDGAT